jgi:hypothetical protein
MTRADYRPFIPDAEKSWIAGATPKEHTAARMKSERAQGLFAAWAKLYESRFTGITTDGRIVPDLFALAPEGAPTAAAAAAVEAAGALLGLLRSEQAAAMSFPVESKQWRNWQNTELHVEDSGLRLDAVPQRIRDATLNVVRASLSAKGYETVRDVMKLNQFLGHLVGGPDVLSEWAFTFRLFGTPSTEQPWGWHLFGHHLTLNCFLLGGQMVLSPFFFGAEPKFCDAGPFAGISLFEDEERKGLALMHSFTENQRAQAIVAHSMAGGDLPVGRRHFADNLHLGGAYQDNRIIPYEGLTGADLTAAQRRALLDLARAYVAPLPDGPLEARMAEIERHLDATHFCWIGSTAEDGAFYYRIQSPVVMIEFDHHAGVFLTNEEPMSFHVHTIVRTPNGNDYGADLLRRHYENAPHHRGR